MIPNPFQPALTKEKFKTRVEGFVLNHDYTYLDAIIEVCDEYGVEYESIISLIPPPMIAKLEVEAQNRNILPKGNDLTAFFDN